MMNDTKNKNLPPTTAVLAVTDEREKQLVELHSSVNRDTATIGKLLIEMRSAHPRGQWTGYLKSLASRTGISERSLFRYVAAVEKPPKVEKAAHADFRTARSPHGHDMAVLQSWLQKAIRRGDEKNALYATAQFALTGFPGAVFNICVTAASEDIGLAEHGLVQEIVALHAAYKIEAARNSEHHPERLQLTHAVLLCCRARKSRLVDHALIVAFEGGEEIAPPEWVFDFHTHQGKAAGKTADDFFKTENPSMSPKADIADPYVNEAKSIRVASSSKKAAEAELIYRVRSFPA
jgi:replication-associated recombination protein RarA